MHIVAFVSQLSLEKQFDIEFDRRFTRIQHQMLSHRSEGFQRNTFLVVFTKRTFLTFILTKHDVVTSLTSNYDYGVIDIMTFCNCNVIVTRLICMFITRV